MQRSVKEYRERGLVRGVCVTVLGVTKFVYAPIPVILCSLISEILSEHPILHFLHPQFFFNVTSCDFDVVRLRFRNFVVCISPRSYRNISFQRLFHSLIS